MGNLLTLLTIINKKQTNCLMKFTFSEKFWLQRYQALLKELGCEIDDFRLMSNCSVKEMMADLHISHPVLKKY
jgi:hypothetical protein